MAPTILLLAVAQALVARGGGEETGKPEPSNMPVEDPSEFYGTLRAVGGAVGAVLSPAAFVMIEEADRASGRYPEGLLVVNDSGGAPDPELAVGQSVTAFGGLEELGYEEAEQETGLELDDEALARYRGEPWMSGRRPRSGSARRDYPVSPTAVDARPAAGEPSERGIRLAGGRKARNENP